jgi:hypothetical protein
MKKSTNKHQKTIPFWICLIVSIGLLIGGFFVPPMGVIDGSLLTGIGLLLIYALVAQLPTILESAGYAKITSGNTTIEISKDDDE